MHRELLVHLICHVTLTAAPRKTHRWGGFVQGMVVVAAVSTALAIGVALLSVFMLRNVRPGGDSGVTADTGPGVDAVGGSEPQGAGAGGV